MPLPQLGEGGWPKAERSHPGVCPRRRIGMASVGATLAVVRKPSPCQGEMAEGQRGEGQAPPKGADEGAHRELPGSFVGAAHLDRPHPSL